MIKGFGLQLFTVDYQINVSYVFFFFLLISDFGFGIWDLGRVTCTQKNTSLSFTGN